MHASILSSKSWSILFCVVGGFDSLLRHLAYRAAGKTFGLATAIFFSPNTAGVRCRHDLIQNKSRRGHGCYLCRHSLRARVFSLSIPLLLWFSLHLHGTFFCCLLPIDLRLKCVCVVIATTCSIHEVVLPGWQAVESVLPGANIETHAPVWTWHITCGLPIALVYISGGGMNCVSCHICVYKTFGLFLFFPGGYSSDPE